MAELWLEINKTLIWGRIMVWALIEPSSFGDFFPEGEFIGRKEQMAEYFGQMPADFQAKFNGSVASYKNYASSKFTHEIGDKLGEKPPITSIEPHEKPSWFETEKSYNTLGAVILTTNGLLAACEDLKNLIEHLEPGVHTFWPIQITMPKGVVYPKQYFGMVIGRFFDCLMPEQCSEGVLKKEENYESYFVRMETKQNLAEVAMSKAVFGNAHIWRERKLRRPNLCFSDALQAEIAKADLRMPKHYRMNEVA